MNRRNYLDLDIDEQLSYLANLEGRGIRTDLSPTRKALSLLNHPEMAVPTVIVGGTNGKGSTVSMIGNIIRHAEYSVGCYYSPHVLYVGERIEFDNQPISPDDLAGLIRRIRGTIEGHVDLTYFEFLTVSAYLWFAEKKADLAVMEVGMGGRFDATNVTEALVSVITTVSLDHTQYLGNTEEDIAMEKVQIVGPGGTLIAGRMSATVANVVREHVKKTGAGALFLGEDFYGIEKMGTDTDTDFTMDYRGLSCYLDDIRLSLAGKHQVDNAAVALAAIEVLRKRGIRITDTAIRQGMASARLLGRTQRISDNPEVIVDVGHNPAGARALAGFLRTLPKKRTALVVGMMADKDIEGFIGELDGEASIIVLAPPRVGRSASIQALKEAGRCSNKEILAMENIGQAVKRARDVVGEGGRVVVTGSFYTVKEAMETIIGHSETDRRST